ncbi:MAG: cupin domain-containing protein [Gammaproteobacteria bacterium]
MGRETTFVNGDIVPIFTDLGENIRQKWAKYNYSEDALAETASEILDNTKLHQQISPNDIIDLALKPDPMLSAHQVDSPFGDLQQITYRHAKFFIEVLYWSDGATAIHDHGFSGSFYVMHGSSINAEYTFDKTDKINHHFWFGQLSKPTISKLSAGSIKPIYSGRRFIHSVFHLDNPTISVVVRTHQDDDAMPQFEYRGSKIGLVEEFSPEFAKKVQGLKFLLSSNNEKFIKCFKEIYIESPLDEKYWLIRAFYINLCKISVLWEFINHTNDERIRCIIQSVGEEALLSKIIKLRAKIQDPELRYFIALLMNLPTWEGIVDFIKNNYFNDPNIVIARCFTKLTSLGYKITDINEAYSIGKKKPLIESSSLIDLPELITLDNVLNKTIINKICASD